MPVPNYFRPRRKPLDLRKLTGGLSEADVLTAIEAGARFFVCQWVVSALIVSYRDNKVVYVSPGESPAAKILPFTLLTLVCGWWGFPWGLIRTPQVLIANLRGGTDITDVISDKLRAARQRETTVDAETSVSSAPVITAAQPLN